MDRQELLKLSAAENAMVKEGKFIEALYQFFAFDCKGFDFDGSITNSLEEKLHKANTDISKIEKINSITLHRTAVSDDAVFAEYTFDFDMKDGGKIVWHEIIRTVWKDGKIVEEQYFKS